jgi:hypothetical protein
MLTAFAIFAVLIVLWAVLPRDAKAPAEPSGPDAA